MKKVITTGLLVLVAVVAFALEVPEEGTYISDAFIVVDTKTGEKIGEYSEDIKITIVYTGENLRFIDYDREVDITAKAYDLERGNIGAIFTNRSAGIFEKDDDGYYWFYLRILFGSLDYTFMFHMVQVEDLRASDNKVKSWKTYIHKRSER
jgi:hypothetical protein